MKKILIIAGIIVVAIIMGTFFINIYEADTEVTKETTKVGVLFNGSIEDKSWGQSHYEGLQKTAKDLNLSLTYRENVSDTDAFEIIEEFIENGCEIIVANSFIFSDAISDASKKYPEVYFLHATGTGKGKNLSTYFGRIYQIRYLSGIVAGLQTETNEIGYVAAFPISEVNRGINAFTLGVKSVNPQAKVYVTWTNSWVGDIEAKEATESLISEHNIDVITMHTDTIKPLDVAEENGIMAIGYNIDNGAFYPESYLTAAVWDWENFYTPHILKCLQGKFEGNHYWEGVESGVISLAPFSDKIKPEIEDAVEKEMVRLQSGTFDVFYGPIYDNTGVLRVEEGTCMTDNSMLNEFDWYVEGVVNDETR